MIKEKVRGEYHTKGVLRAKIYCELLDGAKGVSELTNKIYGNQSASNLGAIYLVIEEMVKTDAATPIVNEGELRFKVDLPGKVDRESLKKALETVAGLGLN